MAKQDENQFDTTSMRTCPNIQNKGEWTGLERMRALFQTRAKACDLQFEDTEAATWRKAAAEVAKFQTSCVELF